MAALQAEPRGQGTDLAKPLEQIAQTVRKRGLVVLISDLLADPEVLRTKLGYLRSRGHDVVAFRVLDPAELTFSFSASSIFQDVESGRRVYIDPAAARAQYLERFSTHADKLQEICRELNVDYVPCPTDRPLELSLFDLLRTRLQRGRRHVRHTMAGRASR